MMMIKKNNLWTRTVIALCVFGGYLFLVPAAFAATLSLTPDTGVYTAGGTFTARVVVNTQGKSINAADGTLSFNASELSVLGITKGSIFNLWTAEPAFSNSAGTISFSGGNPTGYSGRSGTVLSVTFRIKNAGTSKVTFKNGSVLAADGLGTNVLTAMSGGSYTVAAVADTPEPEVIEYVAPANTPAAPVITSESHADPSSYHNQTVAELAWQLPEGITAVRTLLDDAAGSIPTKVYDTPIDSISIPDLDEGVQYFHLQFKNADGWGKVAHYRLAVDTAPPKTFTISLPEDADLTSPDQSLLLQIEDEISAVSRFLVQIDGGEPFEYIDSDATGKLDISDLEPGHHTVIIEAFDEAGNALISTFSFSILSFDKPQFTEYPTEINEEVIPVLSGITRPHSVVTISLTKVGAAETTYEVTAEEDGVFTFIPEGRFTTGVYKIHAIATDQYGAQSDPSEEITIAVQEPGYLQIGSLVVSVLSVLIPLAALVFITVFAVWYLVFKLRRLRGGVRRETKEALAIVEQEFKQLQKALKTEAENLAATRKTNKLTKAETALVESVEKSLSEAKSRVSKEVHDVEEIID